MVSGGARAVQLRSRGADRRVFLDTVSEAAGICRDAGALCIVSDQIDVAIAGGADGVHLGQKDLPVAVARSIVPQGMLVGATVYNLPQARQAVEQGADYIMAGPVFVSQNSIEPKLEGIGTRLLVELLHTIPVPVIAYGGIFRDNVHALRPRNPFTGHVPAIALDDDPYEQSLYFSSLLRRDHEPLPPAQKK